MLRAIQAAATALLLASAPIALCVAPASASDLSDAYNNQTDLQFRKGMQMRLAWTGDYRGEFSGMFDAASLRAVRYFQARHGLEASGVIDEALLRLLIAESDAAQKAVGFGFVDDATTGLRVALPLDLVSDHGETPIGRVWRSSDGDIEIETVRLAGSGQTVEGVHAMLSQATAARSVDADIRFDDGFTVSGTENGRSYVMRFKGVDGDVRGFGVSYEPGEASRIASYVSVAANLFDPELAPAVTARNGLPPFGLQAVEAPMSAAPAHRFSALFQADAPPAPADESIAPKESDSSGSGFAVSRDGWVLTNAHVAGSCRSVMVGDRGIADKVVVDETSDLAAVHVGATFTETLPIAEKAPRLGEDVLALGFPLRSILADSLNVTRGNVSSLLGLRDDPRYLQTSAPVQRGNSGGPLVDLSGRVVGIVTAKLDAVAVADATGDIPQSINFAIRPDAAASFLRSQGIGFTSAGATEGSGSVADTTAKVQDAVVPILCLGAGE